MVEEIPAEMPLHGVVHAAGVLDDGVLREQTAERFEKVMRPKVEGAWNLHELTQGKELEFFILFSSMSGVLGAAGQSNYAAANTFLDAVAAHRRGAGQAGQSLAWGAWSEAGMAAGLSKQQQGRLARQGIQELSPEQGLELMARAMRRSEAQLGAMALDLEAVRRGQGGEVAPVWRALRPSAASTCACR